MSQLTGWLIVLLSIIGHTEWWVLLVNRSHALPIRATRLKRVRHIHDLAVILYPFVLLWLTESGPHSLLRGGRFGDQTTTVQWLLWVTLTGCVPFTLGVARWQLLRRAQFHHADQRVRHDVLSQASNGPDASDVKGPRKHVLQRWPLNEVFHLEVNTKSVRIPTRQNKKETAEKPLRIVHLTDLHFIGCPGADFYRYVVDLAAAMKADAYIFTGDLIDDVALLPVAIEILQPLTKLAPCYFILGNHDWRFDHDHIRQQVSASGWRCVTGRYDLAAIGGRNVLFAGSERPWMGDAPPLVKDAGCDVRILLCHSPDQIRFAQRCGYDLMLSGHTHGGQVVLPFIGPVYSPSLYGVSYVSGLFQLGNMTLHVSRGIGAKDPMRWRCSPELTCLEVFC